MALTDIRGVDASALRDKKLWLFDMDGTIYLGMRLFPGTIPLFNEIKRRGARSVLVTNNSSRSVDAYIEKLAKMGIPSTKEDFFTSVQATVLYLRKHHPGARVYAQGTRTFISELREAGIDVTEEVDKSARVVLLGFDTELTHEKLNRTSEMLTGFKGAYLAANLDLVCPTEYGYVPDCGSMAIGLQNATGLYPKGIGKPEPTMLEIACEKCGVTKEEAVMIGDRLYTDIASGVNAGIDTICVLSGEASYEETVAYEKQPRWIFESVQTIYNLLKE